MSEVRGFKRQLSSTVKDKETEVYLAEAVYVRDLTRGGHCKRKIVTTSISPGGDILMTYLANIDLVGRIFHICSQQVGNMPLRQSFST